MNKASASRTAHQESRRGPVDASGGHHGDDEPSGDQEDKPPESSGSCLSSASEPLTGFCHSLPGLSPTFPENERSQQFRNQHYPHITSGQWSDWRWQLKNRIRRLKDLQKLFNLTADEMQAFRRGEPKLPMALTPYYASLMDPENGNDPLRRTHIPVGGERVVSPQELIDPLGEEDRTVVPGLVHRYPDRVLLMATRQCATYCRYCTRSRMVGTQPHEKIQGFRQHWRQAVDHIAGDERIRDVVISGGDPLTLGDEELGVLLQRLADIPHVEILRIGTKVPMVLPMRITPALTALLGRFKSLWINIHCTHPDELTPEASVALGRLADAGLPLGAQTVLLAGINDDAQTLKRLYHGLLRHRVRPYYLYQCDPIPGSAHFRTPVAKGLEIISQLRGFTSGLAVPNYVIDAPDNGGKIPVLPGMPLRREEGDLLLTNYQGRICRYPDGMAGDPHCD
ncbi:MAG: lysine 2,3-aminomutase YodO family protein [Magnetococcales bacterium]|nr:lysine 2,3-aminomutase YodO family protein [Magnetococcales bacterium]HIJ85978.1 KamA family radical SAM protein [Magnetococcales bacterium]